MDRNFRSFLILSIGLLFIFLGLQRMFLPNNVPKPTEIAKSDEEQNSQDAPAVEKPTSGAEVTAIPENPAEANSPQASKESPTESTVSRVLATSPERVTSLGSMDPSKGYQLLVTLTSRGGGIERIELVDERKEDRFRYRALEHQGGYLGYLGPRPAEGGVLITSIPDGSPAAFAKSSAVSGGLLAGDLLVSINDTDVSSPNDLQRYLLKQKPGTEVEVAVRRTVDGKSTKIVFKTELSQPPLDVLRTHENVHEQVPGNLERLSCLTTLASINKEKIPVGQRAFPMLKRTLSENWEMSKLEVPGGDGVEFRLPLGPFLEGSEFPKDLVLVKRYRLLPLKDGNSVEARAEAYTLDYETLVENQGPSAVNLSFRHEGLTGVTLEGWWYSVKVSPYFFKGAGQRDVRYCDATGNHQIVLTRTIFDRKLNTPRDPGLFVDAGGTDAMKSLSYVGLDAQYFASAIVPHPDQPGGLQGISQAGTDAVANVKAIKSAQAQATNVTFWFDTAEQQVESGKSYSTRYKIFAGPKDPKLLSHFGLDRFIEYGWFPLIAKPLSWILYGFYSIVRNYGIAIVLLTLLVRGSLFPLGRQAAINAQKMQELQPELKKINDLYKEDMPKRAEAMRELYAKHNFRPLSSCLPMFFQIPIFIGLYRCLSVDISLRQEPLIPGLGWCSNLAGPDMLFDWSSWMPEIIAGRGTGYLGPYFNILPVITVSLFLVQQKILMPKATDEQTQMTQNMMQIMTVVMGVLFFKVPSGLCIYFITSSLWSLAERKLVKRLVPPKPSNSSAVTAAPAVSNRPTKSSDVRTVVEEKKKPTKFNEMMSQLKEMLDKPAMKSGTHRNEDAADRNKNGRDSSKRGDKKKRRD